MKVKIVLFVMIMLSFLFLNGKTININFSVETGTIKNLLGTNKGPGGFSAGFQDAGISIARTHDYYDASDYCFYSDFWIYDTINDTFTTINPNFDPTDPSHYFWTTTDTQIDSLVNIGVEIYFRLGVSYPVPTYHGTYEPPFDYGANTFSNFAELCKRTAMHYNEAWDNGMNANIQYWEIWNEPDGLFWYGTPLDFFNMFKTVYFKLKDYDPNLKVGGPGVTPKTTFGYENLYSNTFLEYMANNNVDLDFYSWHLYGAENPYGIKMYADSIRNKLDSYGFTNAESHLNEINYDLHNLAPHIDCPLGATYILSCLLTAQNAPIDKLFWYTARGFFRSDSLNLPRYTYNGYAYKSFNYLLKNTPIQIHSSGNEVIEGNIDADTTNFMVLAAKSTNQNKVYILISNYNSQHENFDITINNLPWVNSDSIFVKKNIIKQNYKFTEYSDTLSGSNSLTLHIDDMPSPSFVLLRLEKHTTTNITNNSDNITLHLHQNLPNPFNPNTSIKIDLPRKEKLILKIFDINGKLIKIMANGIYSKGIHKFIWNGKNQKGEPMPSGIYFYQAISNNYSETKKMLLLK